MLFLVAILFLGSGILIGILSIIIPQEALTIGGLILTFIGLLCLLTNMIIGKLDEIVKALSPAAAIEIDDALDRHRQLAEDADKRETKWQSLQDDSTAFAATCSNDDSSITCTSTDERLDLYWRPGQENW